MQHGAVGELFQKSGPEGRRIGRRVATAGLWVEWHPMHGPGRRRPWRGAADEHRAQIVDLSLTGAMAVVWNAAELAPRDLVAISLEGADGVCRVRRIAARDQGAVAYGVEFTQLAPALDQRIHELVNRDPSLEGRWHAAR